MQSVAVLALAGLSAGHGAMNLPRPRNAGNSSVHPSPGHDKSCVGDSCYWYQVGCFIGCEECSSEGKDLYPQPSCSTPMEPINNDPRTRTWDPWGQSKHGDFTKHNPWRAPGKAPVVDSCGVASGYKPGASGSKGAEIPAGYEMFSKGSEVLPEIETTYWRAGGTAVVGWAIAAQHGGGYAYRLCPKNEKPTEACFQAHHLTFANSNTSIRYDDGSRDDYKIATTDFFTPEGQQWRRNPIPGCACDVGLSCGRKGKDDNRKYHGHLEGYVDFTPYAQHASPTADCPHGTMFEPGWGEGTNPGFLVGSPKPWSIIDEVHVPNQPGEYILSWRWDCEETAQVWSSCADITITEHIPPTPAPTPSPPGPSPSPKPGKGCKAVENPQCQGSPFDDRKSCWMSGCKKCDDDTTIDCAVCCEGCTLDSKGGKTYCDKPTDVFV